MQPVDLTTERLVLSTPVDADIDAIYAACQDPDIQQYTTVPSPYRRSDAEWFVAKVAEWWDAETEATWAIRHTGELTGVVSLCRTDSRIRAEGGAAEIGFWMAPQARGRGFLAEGAHAAIDWGFDPEGFGVERIEWRAVVGNLGSARAAQALGFQYEGLMRSALVSPRGRADGWVAALLPGDDRRPRQWSLTQ